MKKILASLLLATLLLAACSKDEDPADSRARVFYNLDSLVTIESVFVTLDDGNSTWNFKPHNFKPTAADSTLFTSPEVQTLGDGQLRMTFQLKTSNGDSFCSGSLKAPISPNWRWTFEILHARRDFAIACPDCWNITEYDIVGEAYADEAINILWRGRGP